MAESSKSGLLSDLGEGGAAAFDDSVDHLSALNLKEQGTGPLKKQIGR